MYFECDLFDIAEWVCVRVRVVCLGIYNIHMGDLSIHNNIFVFLFSQQILFIIYIWLNYSQFSQLDFIQFQTYKITMRSQYLMYKLWFTIRLM